MNREDVLLTNMIRSLLLGVPFVGALLAFVAMRARDGRMPVTDWLDPMLAALTLVTILFVQLVIILIWKRLGDGKLKRISSWGLIVSQWAYTFGEVLSNTITIGEPPKDIGSLFEIAAGSLFIVLTIALFIVFTRQITNKSDKGRIVLTLNAVVIGLGLIWWFTHPIDQSTPGSPQYIENNPVYNFFH